MLRVALLALATCTAGSFADAPAAGTPPVVSHTQVNVSLPGIDVCGLSVDSVVRGTDTFTVFFDRFGNATTIQDVSHVVSTLTNEANGEVVYVENASRDRFSAEPVVNADGTLTFEDTLTGMPIRVYTSHSSVIVRDVGLTSIVDTFDADGNFLDEQVTVRGPHQFTGDFGVFCDAITSAIG
jgi:hypothetical protein